MQPTDVPQKPEREPTRGRFDLREYATPRTELSAKDRIEQLIESIRGRGARNHATPLNEHSVKDRIEQLLSSIRNSRTTSDYATVPICMDARIPGPSMVHDARRMLSKGYYWSFSASRRTFVEKGKVTGVVKTPKTRDGLKRYPWSVGPATVQDYAAVPDGIETVNETLLMRNGHYWGFSESGSAFGETAPAARNSDIPRVFPGFDIGCIPQQQTYYPLLPVPLTSCINQSPEEN